MFLKSCVANRFYFWTFFFFFCEFGCWRMITILLLVTVALSCLKTYDLYTSTIVYVSGELLHTIGA